MQNSLLFAFVLLSRQRSWWQVTPGYSINYLGGESNFSMTCSCYSKPNFDILLGKVCWECPGISKYCWFSCLFEWKAVLFCFMTFPVPAYCTGPAPLQYCLSPHSALSEMLNLAWLCLNAASVRDGWRFTLIRAGPKIVLSLTKSSIFSQCMWTATMNGSCHQRPCPCTKVELFCGHMDPTSRSQPPKIKIMLVWKQGCDLGAKMKMRQPGYICPALQVEVFNWKVTL